MIIRQCTKIVLLALFSLFSVSACVTNPDTANPNADVTSIPISEESFKSIVTKGDEALSRRAYSEAQVQYALAIKERPNNIDLLYKLAIVHYEKDSFNVETELLKAVLQTDTSHIGAYEMLGLIALRNENITVAEENLTKALSFDSYRWRSLNAMGVVNDMQSKHTQAQQHFQNALRNSPNKAQIENNLGYSFYLDGHYRQAEQHFRKATQLNPNYEKAWANLGLVFVRNKQYEDARYAFNKITEEHISSNNLGYLAMLQNDDDMARQEIARAILLAPTYYPKASENLVTLNGKGDLTDQVGVATVGNDEIDKRSNATSKNVSAIVNENIANVVDNQPQVVIAKSNYSVPNIEKKKKIAKSSMKLASSEKRLNEQYLALLGHQFDSENAESVSSAVLSFQASHQLEPTGMLDDITKGKLATEATLKVKSLLVSFNYGANLNSLHVDDMTSSALTNFQTDNNLPISGVIDENTLTILIRYVDGGSVAAKSE